MDLDLNAIGLILEEQKLKEVESLKNKEYQKLKSRIISVDKVLNSVKIWKEHATNVKIELESEREQHKESIVKYVSLDQAHKESLHQINEFESEKKNADKLKAVVSQQAETLEVLQKNVASLMSNNQSYKQDLRVKTKEISSIRNVERRRHNLLIKQLIIYGDLAKEAGLLNHSQSTSLARFKKQVQKDRSDIDKILDISDVENESSTYESSDTGRGSSLETFEDDKYSISSSLYENCSFKDISSPLTDTNNLNVMFSPERPVLENHETPHSEELFTDFEKNISYDKSTVPIRSSIGGDMICSPVEAVDNIEKAPDLKKEGKNIMDRCTSPFRNNVHSVETSTSPIKICHDYKATQSPNNLHKILYDRSTSPIRNIIPSVDVACSPIKMENEDESNKNNLNTLSKCENKCTNPVSISEQYVDTLSSPTRPEYEYSNSEISPLEKNMFSNSAFYPIIQSPMRLEEHSNDCNSPLNNIKIARTACDPVLPSPRSVEECSNGRLSPLEKVQIPNTECHQISKHHQYLDKNDTSNEEDTIIDKEIAFILEDVCKIPKLISPIPNDRFKFSNSTHFRRLVTRRKRGPVHGVAGLNIQRQMKNSTTNACLKKLTRNVASLNRKFINFSSKASQMDIIMPQILRLLQTTNSIKNISDYESSPSKKYHQNDTKHLKCSDLNSDFNSSKCSYTEKDKVESNIGSNFKKSKIKKLNIVDLFGEDDSCPDTLSKDCSNNSLNDSISSCEAHTTAEAPTDLKLDIEKKSFSLNTKRKLGFSEKDESSEKRIKNTISGSPVKSVNIQQLGNHEKIKSPLRQSHRLAAVSPELEKMSSHAVVKSYRNERLLSQPNKNISNHQIVPECETLRVSSENLLSSKYVDHKIISPAPMIQAQMNVKSSSIGARSLHKSHEIDVKTSDLGEESVTPKLNMVNKSEVIKVPNIITENIKNKMENTSYQKELLESKTSNTEVFGEKIVVEYRRLPLSEISTRAKSISHYFIAPLSEPSGTCNLPNISKTSDLHDVIPPLTQLFERRTSTDISRTMPDSHNVKVPLSELSGRCNLSKVSKTADTYDDIPPLSKPCGRRISNVTRKTSDYHIIDPLSELSSRLTSSNITIKTESDSQHVISASSERCNSLNISRTAADSHKAIIALSSEPSGRCNSSNMSRTSDSHVIPPLSQPCGRRIAHVTRKTFDYHIIDPLSELSSRLTSSNIKMKTEPDSHNVISTSSERCNSLNISRTAADSHKAIIALSSEPSGRCNSSNMSRTSDSHVIPPLSQPCGRRIAHVTRKTSDYHIIDPLSELSSRLTSSNIKMKTASDSHDFISPLSQPIEGRTSSYVSRAVSDSHIVATLSEQSQENISTEVLFTFDDILRNYAGDVITKVKVQKTRKDENKMKILIMLEDKLAAEPNTTLESFQLKKVCNILTKEKPKHVARAMIEFMMSENRAKDVICKTYTPPAPPMLKSEQRLVLCVRELVAQTSFSPKCSFLNILQSGIEYILFRLSIESTPKIPQVERLAHFYAVLCRMYNQPIKLRYLIVDALYSLSYKAIPLVIKVIEVWSQILPMADTNSAKNPLVIVIIHLLHFFKTTKVKLINVQDSAQKIRQILFKKYNYKMGEFGQSELLTFLKRSIESDMKNNQEDIMMAFVLVAKRYGVMWCHKHIEQDILVPAICDRSAPPYTRLMAVKLIGPLLRPYSVTMKPHCEAAVLKLSSVLREADSREIEEAAIGSLFYLRRQCFVQLVDIFRSWKPKYEPSDLIKQQFKLFVGEKPIAVWNKILIS